MHIQTSDQEELQLGFGDYTCNWGAHICALYETEQERDELVYGFLRQGYLDGDLQLYCSSEDSQEAFKQGFPQACPECSRHVHDTNCFQLYSAEELYYPNGSFSPNEMVAGLNRFFQDSQHDGARNIRGTASLGWSLGAIPGAEHVMAYEARLNHFIKGKPWISICLYDVNRFSGAAIMNVLKTHPFSISGSVLTRNPYFQDPDKWLAENAPEFLSGKPEGAKSRP